MGVGGLTLGAGSLAGGGADVDAAISELEAMSPEMTEEAATLAEGTSGAENALNGARLNQQLSAQSAFAPNGELSQEAIAGSRQIIAPEDLNNLAIPEGFAKYSTGTYNSPSGSFQVHYYMNPETGETYYGLDYKAVFNNP